MTWTSHNDLVLHILSPSLAVSFFDSDMLFSLLLFRADPRDIGVVLWAGCKRTGVCSPALPRHKSGSGKCRL